MRENRGVQTQRSLSGPWAALAAVRFLAELGMLAALGYVGLRLLAGSPALALLLALVLTATAAAVWAAWVAPRAKSRLDDPARLAVEIALFATACAGLLVVGGDLARIAAGVLALAYAVSAPVGRKGF